MSDLQPDKNTSVFPHTRIDRSTWKRVRLGDVCEISKGEQLNRATLAEKGRIPVYNGGSSPSGYAEESNTAAESVIISEGGNSCGYVNFIHVPFWRGGHCYLVETDLDKSLLYYVLKANEPQIMSLRVGTGLPNIQRERLEAFEFDLPTDSTEQRQIVTTCISIDTHITALQALIAKYEAIKKATVNLLLKPKSGWRQISLGDIGDVLMCKRILKNQTTETGDVPFYKIGTFGRTPDAFISRVLFDDFKARFSYPQKGDVLLSAAGTIGRTIVFNGEDAYFQDSNIVWIDNDERIVTNRFLHVLYGQLDWQTENGGTVSRLYNANIRNTRIAIPSLEEQKRIVAILNSINGTISGLKSQLAKAQDIKQGMMAYFFG